MDEAIKLVDKWLRIASERTMLSSEEVTDLLLDVRVAMTQPTDDVEQDPALEPEPIPVG